MRKYGLGKKSYAAYSLDYKRQWPAYSFSNIMRSQKYIWSPIVNFLEILSALKDPLEEIFKVTETTGKNCVAICYHRRNDFSDLLKNCSFSMNSLERGLENLGLLENGRRDSFYYRSVFHPEKGSHANLPPGKIYLEYRTPNHNQRTP